MKFKIAKRVLALVLSFTLALALFAPIAVSADQASWQAVLNSPYVSPNGAGGAAPTVTATAEGLVVTNRGEGQHDNNRGIFVDIAGLRALGDGGDIVVEGTAAVGITMQFQGVATEDTPVEPDETWSMTVAADYDISLPGWAGWADSPFIGTTAIGEAMQPRYVVTSITVGGVHIFELLGLAAPEVADDDEEDEEDEDCCADDEHYNGAEYDYEDVIDIEEISEVIEEVESVMVLTIGSTVYTIDGQAGSMIYAPFIADGRTMVPVRYIAEAMGADIDFVGGVVVITRGANVVQLPVGEELPGGMGAAEIRDGRTLVPVRFVVEELGADIDWDGAAQTVTIFLGVAAAPPAVAPPVVVPPVVVPPVVAGEGDPAGIRVSTDRGVAAGVNIVIGSGTDVWPFADDYEGIRAFDPVPGATYRITFNVTNGSTDGWRIRWGRGTGLFGDARYPAGDVAIVNDYEVDLEGGSATMTVVPSRINGAEAGGTYTLIQYVTLDGSQVYDGAIGNIWLSGLFGNSDFDVNWVTIEHNGTLLARWDA
ncbi:MAG: copper amine oxidase N-terminal domain-containing protein [Defluviitaleaceae bacterium]|nr:copper amine oxidase N-terminal domain-containing protein [Defluviitaleaceae bacterium]